MARRRGERLYSLSEVSTRTGISLASLRRYRTLYSDRVPSIGEGRRQRFPAGALLVFQQLKEEGMARRGRGARRAKAGRTGPGTGAERRGRRRGGAAREARQVKRPRAKGRRARAAAAPANRDSLLTLVEIGRRTGISYPTLLRYVRLHLDRLPHLGSGRKRRFRPAAVDEFMKLRGESRRGRRSAAATASQPSPALARQLAKLERGQRSLAIQIRDLRRALARPVRFRLER